MKKKQQIINLLFFIFIVTNFIGCASKGLTKKEFDKEYMDTEWYKVFKIYTSRNYSENSFEKGIYEDQNYSTNYQNSVYEIYKFKRKLIVKPVSYTNNIVVFNDDEYRLKEIIFLTKKSKLSMHIVHENNKKEIFSLVVFIDANNITNEELYKIFNTNFEHEYYKLDNSLSIDLNTLVPKMSKIKKIDSTGSSCKVNRYWSIYENSISLPKETIEKFTSLRY